MKTTRALFTHQNLVDRATRFLAAHAFADGAIDSAEFEAIDEEPRCAEESEGFLRWLSSPAAARVLAEA